jgi:hypothetical protein
MTIKSLFVLPAPLECPKLEVRLGPSKIDSNSSTKVNAWIEAHDKFIRYDLFNGKLPILISLDRSGKVLNVPGFVGIDLQQNGLTARLVDEIYEGAPILSGYQFHFSSNNDRTGREYTVFGRQGKSYSYFINLSLGLDVGSISVNVENRNVISSRESIIPFIGEFMLYFYKSDEEISKSLNVCVNDSRRSFQFDNSGNLSQVKPLVVWRDIKDLEEFEEVLGKGTFKSRALKELQVEAREYTEMMKVYERNFAKIRKIDYGDVLNRCVGL